MEFHDRGDGVRIAFSRQEGNGPTVVFLPGYGSDMNGDKAGFLASRLEARGTRYLRLDYSGHGSSDGAFDSGTVGRWRDDALSVIDTYTRGRLILVGSSMGGWIALLIALARAPRIAGLVGIAAAADFTEWGMWRRFSPEQRQQLMRTGSIRVRAPMNDNLRISRELIEDGRLNSLLDGPIPISCPVRLLQGQRDEEVPWQIALKIASLLESTDVQLLLTKDGEHRMSREKDLAALGVAVEDLLLLDRAAPT